MSVRTVYHHKSGAVQVCGMLSFGDAVVTLSRSDAVASQCFTLTADQARAIGQALVAAAESAETAQEARAVADLLDYRRVA